tara:strand:+ start:80 stop:556 length:477 start_codon:yes stop_codon:yes gene_type:complete
MADSKKNKKKSLTEKIIIESKFVKDKNAGFLKGLGQISVLIASIPIGITEAVAVNTYKTVKELNDSRKDKLNKNIRLGAEIKVRRELDNYDSPITDPNKIEELIAKEEAKLHAQKDKRLKMGLLSITGLSVLRSPIALYKTLTGEDIGEDGDDPDMEI